jgi:hypothetical protein
MFLSVITAPIVLVQLIYFSIRGRHVNRIFFLQIRSTMPIQDMNWICLRQYIGADVSFPPLKQVTFWIGVAEGHSIRFAYLSRQCLFIYCSCSKRKRKCWILERNGTFKFKITPDRHNGRKKLNYCILPHHPHFSLPSTFKDLQNCRWWIKFRKSTRGALFFCVGVIDRHIYL